MISWKLRTQGLRPIGLDIGHNSIKMIQLAINGGRISILAADKVRVEAGMDGGEEAGRRFGLDPKEDIINYLVAGNVQNGDEIKNELILFATSDEAIRNHIAMLEEAQLRPVAIDTIPCALFRSFERSRRREEDREQTIVFV